MGKKAASSTDASDASRIAGLLVRYKHEYYQGKPLVSDAEYDRLEDQLRTIDPGNPVLRMVGTDETGEVPHDPPMLSCEKLHAPAEVISWAGTSRITWGYKVDGLSVSLAYADGQLVQGATRGDGKRGDDVTAHCFRLAGVPVTIPDKRLIEVRGEAYIPISRFDASGAFKSPRNLATGTLKSKDPSTVAQRGVTYMAWDLILPGAPINTSQKVAMLSAWGFACADQDVIEPKDIARVFADIENRRATFDFEMDGLVFKIEDGPTRDAMGTTEHHPRWMVALKFEAQGATTEVKSIDWQVGRSGKLTPVATFEPIDVGGATLERATCHNARFVTDNDIAIGDEVEIIRSGDVIPKITGVAHKGPDHATFPSICPECGSPVTRDSTDIKCPNPACAAAVFQHIRHFISATRIEQVGEKSLEELWDKGLVRSPADLYKLDRAILSDMFGKNGEKMHDQIQAKKILPLRTFLEAIGISRMEKVTARKIADAFKTFEAVTRASIGDLESIDGIGTVTARGIYTGLQDPSLYQPLLDAGVTIEASKVASPTHTVVLGSSAPPLKTASTTAKITGVEPSPLSGKRVYVTGSLPGFKKAELESLVESLGGTWASISKSLDLLVIGNDPGQVKVDKAKVYGIPTMDGTAFIALIRDTRESSQV